MNLKKARSNRNLTQRQLAELAGVSQVAIHLLEHGKMVGKAKTRIRIEQILNAKIDWMNMRLNFLLEGIPVEERCEFIKSIKKSLDKQYLEVGEI